MVQSTRSRRALKALGSGASANLFTARPAARAVAPPVLSRAAQRRLKWFDYARTHSPTQTCRHFDIARSVYYYGKARYRPDDLTSLENRSSRPKRVRGRQWTAEQAEAVRQVREAHPRWGKAKLAVLLAREGITLSVSTIGRILRYLRWAWGAARAETGAGHPPCPSCPPPRPAQAKGGGAGKGEAGRPRGN